MAELDKVELVVALLTERILDQLALPVEGARRMFGGHLVEGFGLVEAHATVLVGVEQTEGYAVYVALESIGYWLEN